MDFLECVRLENDTKKFTDWGKITFQNFTAIDENRKSMQYSTSEPAGW